MFGERLSFNPTDLDFINEVLEDYRICVLSREVSQLARKEVLTGKAKFGITGDGKEVAQVAQARAFQKGDFRAGYYRDQTILFALGLATVEQYFSQLYADVYNDPFSGGRQMNCHFATPFIDENGEYLDLVNSYNVSSDNSCTAGQVARAIGLAAASKSFRQVDLSAFEDYAKLSNNGNEITFCNIGDGSTSEGPFWEMMNAAAVTKVPLLTSVWDDGFAISVPTRYQTTKGSISKAMSGLHIDENGDGILLYVLDGWDYPQLVHTYEKVAKRVREEHIPALIHVKDLTQPQGHSTSGSHERYKSKDRLQFEVDFDCNLQFRNWILENSIATEDELQNLEKTTIKEVRTAKNRAWSAYLKPLAGTQAELVRLFTKISNNSSKKDKLLGITAQLKNAAVVERKSMIRMAKDFLRQVKNETTFEKKELELWLEDMYEDANDYYHTHLHSETPKAALNVPIIDPEYSDDSPMLNGSVVINTFFKEAFAKYPQLIGFGEDVGQLGDVNQGFVGLQDQFGEERVFDTGIREWTIMGQGIGMAMRGLRPIAEIQYLDYIYYGLAPLADDASSIRYRTKGLQSVPMIVRTRGHRLEGVWHSGSPISMIINAIRGMYLLVPRNFVQAAGLYNTMLQSDDPCIVIECLNAYRLKEQLPDNIGEYTVPIGVVDMVRQGRDVTIVTYGACVAVAIEAANLLEDHDIFVEVIDVQTMLPFDLDHEIVESLKRTNRIVFLDEDVPGGATAYMMQQVLEEQGGYAFLDSEPVTITAAPHRPPYGSDGDYHSKPNADLVFEKVYTLMNEYNDIKYPKMYFM